MDINKSLAQCEPILKRIVTKYTKRWPAHVAEDVAAQANVRLWMALTGGTFDPARGSLDAFAYTVIKNAVVDQVRQLKAERRLTLLDDDHLHYDSDAEAVALANAIRQTPSDFLPPHLTRVFLALQSHDSPASAAAALNMKVTTLYTLSTRLKRRIQTIFQNGRSRSFTPERKAA